MGIGEIIAAAQEPLGSLFGQWGSGFDDPLCLPPVSADEKGGVREF
jgi:hypothetical protein